MLLRKSRLLVWVVLVCTTFWMSAPASASITLVSLTKIRFVENGWGGEGLAIATQGSGIGGCPAGNTEFAIDAGHPSYRELVAMALLAFSSNADAELVVDSGVCIFGSRTKVISIRLIK